MTTRFVLIFLRKSYFTLIADREMFCAGRVIEEDLNRTMKACGGSIQTTVNDLCDDTLGYCELFEETQVGGERFNFFTGVPKTKTCTIILRGGAEQFMEETERSLHDAIMIVRRYVEYIFFYIAISRKIVLKYCRNRRSLMLQNLKWDN